MRVGNRIPTLNKLYADLDPDFRETISQIIASKGNGYSLLRLLEVCEGLSESDAYSINDFIVEAMNNYKLIDDRSDAYGFSFDNGDRLPVIMNPTLEDILFLTGLPIHGKPVIPEKSRDLDAFARVFGIEILTSLGINMSKDIPLTKLQLLAKGIDYPIEKRIIAVLLFIVHCMIIPSQDGHKCFSSYVQFVEKLEEVDSYAWGAAMLAFLYHGMRTFKEGKKNTIDGSTPILVAFFLYHVPKLQRALGIEVEKVDRPRFLLIPVLHALRSKCHNTRSIANMVNPIFINLADEDVCWHPYRLDMLPPELHQQLKFRTLLAPLFCFNRVVNHSPNLVPKQFLEFDASNRARIEGYLHRIKMKENSGGSSQDFKKHYEKELALWNKGYCVEIICYRRRAPRQSQPITPPENPNHSDPPPSNSSHHSQSHSSEASSSQSAQKSASDSPLQSTSQNSEASNRSQLQSSHSDQHNNSAHRSPPQPSAHRSPLQPSPPQYNPPPPPQHNLTPSPQHNRPPSPPQHNVLAALRTPAVLGIRKKKVPDRLSYPINQIPTRPRKGRRK